MWSGMSSSSRSTVAHWSDHTKQETKAEDLWLQVATANTPANTKRPRLREVLQHGNPMGTGKDIGNRIALAVTITMNTVVLVVVLVVW